jgi:hypothetical protein
VPLGLEASILLVFQTLTPFEWVSYQEERKNGQTAQVFNCRQGSVQADNKNKNQTINSDQFDSEFTESNL